MAQSLEKKYGYPNEGIVLIDLGGGDTAEEPQEMWTPHTCGSCREFDGIYCMKEWNNCDLCYCVPDRDEKDPDADYCDDIDYIEEELEELRDPVRNEYSSDENYKRACTAVEKMRKEQESIEEARYNERMYGKNWWKESDDE